MLLHVTWKAPGPCTWSARYRRDLAFSNCTSDSTCITKDGTHPFSILKVSSSSLGVVEGVKGPFAVTERTWRDERAPWLICVAKVEISCEA